MLLTQVLAAAADNYLSILFPVPVAAAGRDPNAPSRGAGASGRRRSSPSWRCSRRSLASSPFVFLAWLPHLLGERWLWALALPLALAGAGAVYFMATSGAARLLVRREPELVARAAGED